jgi:hypothetical protein
MSNSTFSSLVNYGAYGAAVLHDNEILYQKNIFLSVPVTSVPGPIAGAGLPVSGRLRWSSRLVATASQNRLSIFFVLPTGSGAYPPSPRWGEAPGIEVEARPAFKMGPESETGSRSPRR